MPSILAEVVLANTSGLPADASINTFAFSTEHSTFAAAVADLDDPLIDFYNGSSGQTGTVASYLAGCLVRTSNAAQIKWYDIAGSLDGSPHGSPLATTTWTLGAIAGSTNQFPGECAIACSFKASYATDPEEDGAMRPRARDRGRIFLGPVNDSVDTGGTSPILVSTTVRTDITVAAARLRTAVLAISTPSYWAVWSRADAELKAVVGGWVDNAFDVQRKRGPKTTARTTWGTLT